MGMVATKKEPLKDATAEVTVENEFKETHNQEASLEQYFHIVTHLLTLGKNITAKTTDAVFWKLGVH